MTKKFTFVCVMIIYVEQWFSTRGDFTSQGTFGNVWEPFRLSRLGEQWPLASGRWRPRLLLNILQCTGQAPQQRTIQPKMAIVLWLKNLDVEGELSLPGNQKHRDLLMGHPLCFQQSAWVVAVGKAGRGHGLSSVGCQFCDHVKQSPDAKPPGTDCLHTSTSGSGWLSKISRNNPYRMWPRGWKKSGKSFWLRGPQVQSTWIPIAMR